jgi:nucleoside-diphosphate-sugar epimerase
MNGQRIVLTGATGLIGRSVVDVLRARHQLISVGRSPPPPGIEWIKADLNSLLDLSSMPRSVDTVIYLAQSQYFRDFPDRAPEIFTVNVANVQRMLDWARISGVKRFLLASSGGVYGHGESAFREDDTIGPKGPLGYYLASKHCSELIAGSYSDLFTVVILRFFFVYGPGQRKSMLIPRLIESVRSARPVTLQGPDGIRLNPIFVSDAATAIQRACQLESSHIVNVAGAEVFPLKELVRIIGDKLGREPVFQLNLAEKPGNLVGDTEKMRRLLGAPVISFPDGLGRMLAHEDERP